MKFDELEAKMRAMEGVRDPAALADVYLVARIDGRGFTRLTKELVELEKPFDVRFRDHMIATVQHLMVSGFQPVFGYTQSDEISLLFDRSSNAFSRNIRKWTSLLAGEASAAFSVRMGVAAAFDCRIIELPLSGHVVDYFRWRNEDAHRNALNGWCYWKLRGEGIEPAKCASMLEGASIEEKNELLFQRGVNFNDVPQWQRRGVGIAWEEYEKPAVNPKTGGVGTTVRRRLCVDMELPMRDAFSAYIRRMLGEGA